jgi:PKD repeat protein
MSQSNNKRGPDGPIGSVGRGIQEATVINGELFVTYTDGTSQNSGAVDENATISFAGPQFTYANGILTRIDYDGGAFKTISYNGDGSINVVRLSSGTDAFIKTFSYNPDGSLDAIVETFTTGPSFTITSTITGNSVVLSTPSEATWLFGDGEGTTGTNVSHLYSVGGTYTVSATISGELVTQSITVSDQTMPVGTLSAVAQDPASNVVDLLATGGVSYEWSIGGSTYTTASAQHTFASAGSYTITLRVLDASGNADVFTETLNILMPNQLPVVSFEFTKSLLAYDFTTTALDPDYGDDSSLSYLWDFGDGTTSTFKNPSHTYSAPTIPGDPNGQDFTLSLTVTDDRNGQTVTTEAITVYDFYVLGSELMANVDFTTSDLSDFTGVGSTLSVSGGELTATATDPSNNRVEADVTLTVGTEYLLEVVAKQGTSTTARIKQFVNVDPDITSVAITSVYATYSHNFVATDTSVTLRVYVNGSGSTGDTIILDSFSLKEIL